MRFYANPQTRFDFANGAVGFGPGGPMGCLGPYAKVQSCPIHGTSIRATAYATAYADTMFTVPAYTRVKGHYIGGYLTLDDGAVTFRASDRYLPRLNAALGVL